MQYSSYRNMSDNEDFKENGGGNNGQPHQREVVAFFWEVIKMVILSLAIIVPIRYFLVQPFFVKGASMEDDFHNGDYVLIDELSYRFNSPERGEVIVFRSPQDTSQFFIKRIIGLPGETIQIRNNEMVITNEQDPKGFILDESAYLDKGQTTAGDFKINIDANEYFVLGDNRSHSSDSRIWGAVNRNLVIGKVFLRAWPLNKVDTFKRVPYQNPRL